MPSEDRITGQLQADKITGHQHVNRLCVEIEDTVCETGRIELREMLYSLGIFICRYGQPELWKALWCRFALHDSRSWSVIDGYEEGDEFRAIFGKHWQTALARILATREPSSAGQAPAAA